MRSKILPFSVLGFIFITNLFLFQNCGQEAFVPDDFNNNEVFNNDSEKLDELYGNDESDAVVEAFKMEHAPYSHMPIFHSKDRITQIRSICVKEKHRIRNMRRNGRISVATRDAYLKRIDTKCAYWVRLGNDVFSRFTMEFGNPLRPTYTKRFNCKPRRNSFRNQKARITGTVHYNPTVAAYKFSCGCGEPWLIGKRSSLGGLIYINGKIECGNKTRIVVCHFRPHKHMNQYSYYDVRGNLTVDWVHGSKKTLRVWGMTDMSLSDLSRDNHRFPARIGSSLNKLRVGFVSSHNDIDIDSGPGFQGAEAEECGVIF